MVVGIKAISVQSIQIGFDWDWACQKLYIFEWIQETFVKTQRNSTQLNPTLKQLALELDTVVTCSPPTPPPPQTFQQLLDQLES